MADDLLDLYLKPQEPSDAGAAPVPSASANNVDPLDIYLKSSSGATLATAIPPHKFGLGDTWPVRLMNDIVTGAMAPGNAYKSTPENPVTTEQMIGPANSLAGLVAGGAGSIPSVLSKGAPLIEPETARLAQLARDQMGIPLRGSQLSPSTARMDLVGQNQPFTGFAKNTADQQTGFNRQINLAMGIDEPRVTSKVLSQVKDNYHNAIEDITDNVGTLRFGPTEHANILDTFKQAAVNIPDKIKTIQNKIKVIADNVDQNGEMSAETYKGLMRKGGPFDPSKYSGMEQHHVAQLQENMKDALAANATPQDVANLQKWNQRYAVMKSIEPLVDKNPSGNIPPALLSHVTPSYGKLSDLADIGQLMKSAPTSGTAENLSAFKRWGPFAGIAGLGTLEGAAMWYNPRAALAGLAGAATAATGKSLWNLGKGAYLRSDTMANRLINRSLPNAPSVQPNVFQGITGGIIPSIATGEAMQPPYLQRSPANGM